MPINGKMVGDVHVSVYETLDGQKLFYLEADNEDVLPVADVIEDTLVMY